MCTGSVFGSACATSAWPASWYAMISRSFLLITRLRRRYDQGVAVGTSTNLSQPWHKGNHPGLQLARRLKRKAHQVWLFTTRLDVPATNNGSETAIRGFKLTAKVQGCWRTLATLMRATGSAVRQDSGLVAAGR